MDKFLGGAFLTYGSDVLKFSDMDQENRSDPMIEVRILKLRLPQQLPFNRSLSNCRYSLV